MSNKLGFYNIEVGTLKQNDDQLVLNIKKEKFQYDQLSELNNLTKAKNNFLPLIKLQEQDNEVILTYQIPKQMRSLKTIQHENKAIKIAIAAEIMDQDILNRNEEYVSLNPSNIWFYPMKHVAYAYQANNLMPANDEHSALSRYKALILYCLTGAPYEKLVEQPQAIRNKDEVLQEIAQAKTVTELKRTVKEMADFVTYNEWQAVKEKQQRFHRKLIISISAVVLIAVVLAGLLHKKDERQYQTLAAQDQTQMTALKYDNKIDDALKDKDYDLANELMNKAGLSKTKQAATYLKRSNYQEALKVDPSELNKIVKLAYQNKTQKQIVDWELPNNANENTQRELKLEKAIVSYDTNVMDNQLSFANNDEQLLRMGEAYINHNDTQDAQTVASKLSGIKAKYMNALIKLDQANADLKDAKKKLAEAKDGSSKAKYKAAKSTYASAQDAQKEAQKEAERLKNKVGV